MALGDICTWENLESTGKVMAAAALTGVILLTSAVSVPALVVYAGLSSGCVAAYEIIKNPQRQHI